MGLTEEEVEDEMITWVMGGHETTSSLLSWTFYMLDIHPEVFNALVLKNHRKILV
jgi:cytochrome P450